jgi:hypothetical protein
MRMASPRGYTACCTACVPHAWKPVPHHLYRLHPLLYIEAVQYTASFMYMRGMGTTDAVQV